MLREERTASGSLRRTGGGGLLDGVREGLAWQALAPEGTAWRKLGVGMGSKRPELPLAS